MRDFRRGGPAGYPNTTTDIQSGSVASPDLSGRSNSSWQGSSSGRAPTGPPPAGGWATRRGRLVTPKLNQIFYIGVGRKSDGTPLAYPIPPQATHLYLGIVDAAAFHGPPGYYRDNTGTFSVTLHVGDTASAPPTATKRER